jgi:glyoxylase-like metal-dependent hydrolase (beta-lactamase superfamily II)
MLTATFNQAEILHEQPVQLSPLVRRITADNPSIMTGPGTNTYLIGREQVAVLDPGLNEARHLDAILAACGDRLKWVIATHTHPDHSPGARELAAATGAVLLGNTIDDGDIQDTTFEPQRGFAHDDLFDTGEFRLRALLTPGHVANHVCFLLENEGLLFSGDHLMQGSTVVIIPPHGDMKDYLASLTMLNHYPITALAPGHGQLILDPQHEIRGVIAHRLQREAKVIEVMERLRDGTLDSLTPPVYDDVDPARHGIARYSLWAHLLKLEKEGRVAQRGDEWFWLG